MGSLTREQFYFYEMRTTARLLLEGLSENETVAKNVAENLFQNSTERTIKKAATVCTQRLNALKDDDLVKAIAERESYTAKQICLYAMMKKYRIIWAFMITIIGMKYRQQDMTFKRQDINVFFTQLQEQDDTVASWSESMIKKNESVFSKILIENEYISIDREITYNMVGRYRYMSFYKVNKKNNISTLEHCVEPAKKVSEKDRNNNSVKNSYSVPWEEYGKLDTPIPLMNVICRILEYYFFQMCGYESDELCRIVLEDNIEKFMAEVADGATDYTKFHLAQAMLSYIKRSDSFNDGLYFEDESIDCQQYKEVFWIIFDVMGQTQHYTMMMNEKE